MIFYLLGLLLPAFVDGENGYNYYDESQLAVLEKIKRLKKIGFSGRKNVLSLGLNIIFAAALLALFLKDGKGNTCETLTEITLFSFYFP